METEWEILLLVLLGATSFKVFLSKPGSTELVACGCSMALRVGLRRLGRNCGTKAHCWMILKHSTSLALHWPLVILMAIPSQIWPLAFLMKTSFTIKLIK